MEFSFVRDIYDSLSSTLITSTFTINATLYFVGENVIHDSVVRGFGDNLDGRLTEPVQVDYPLELGQFKRIKVFPIERTLTKKEGNPNVTSIFGNFEPFDRWVSCFESSVSLGNNKTYYDYVSYVLIKNIKYRVKGTYKETFGLKPIIHVFLVKETTDGS